MENTPEIQKLKQKTLEFIDLFVVDALSGDYPSVKFLEVLSGRLDKYNQKREQKGTTIDTIKKDLK